MMRWQKAAMLLALHAGLFLGWAHGELIAVPAAPEQGQRQPPEAEIFAAVKRSLEAAHLPPQDLPRRIIGVTLMASGHYRVHMAMVQGEAWFEVWQAGGQWQVRGLNPPRAGSPNAGR
ncbi:MAG TPA: hypothetical protein VGK74_06505 [Symbiobacteriaceae bacterium]|jgi:hypothetical protein